MALKQGAKEVITGSFPNLSRVVSFLKEQNANIILGCSGWKNRFNIEDTLFAGAVIEEIKDQFTIHCDSSFMANQLYNMHKADMPNYIKTLTHWHRLAASACVKSNFALRNARCVNSPGLAILAPFSIINCKIASCMKGEP